MVKVLWGHPNRVYSSAFSPDSSVLCSVGASKAVRKRVPLRLVCEVCQRGGGVGGVTTYAQSANANQPLSPCFLSPPSLFAVDKSGFFSPEFCMQITACFMMFTFMWA